jgi:hypothetical protein
MFYGEEETSLRIHSLDKNLSNVYKYLVRTVIAASLVAVALHLKHNLDMQTYANKVSTQLEKEGGRAVVGKDGSLTIMMDGKIQDVIPADDRRATGKDSSSIKPEGLELPKRYLRLALANLLNPSYQRKDFKFYVEVVKPDLKN